MAKKEKEIDMRVPQPFTPAMYSEMKNFLNGMPSRTAHLLDISVDEVKNFVKISEDDRTYMADVVEANTLQPDLIVNSVDVPTIGDAALAGQQNRELGNLMVTWGQLLLRNAYQAESFAYQHASTFEQYVDLAIRNKKQGAKMVKDKLVSNRADRERKKAATRNANKEMALTKEPKI